MSRHDSPRYFERPSSESSKSTTTVWFNKATFIYLPQCIGSCSNQQKCGAWTKAFAWFFLWGKGTFPSLPIMIINVFWICVVYWSYSNNLKIVTNGTINNETINDDNKTLKVMWLCFWVFGYLRIPKYPLPTWQLVHLFNGTWLIESETFFGSRCFSLQMSSSIFILMAFKTIRSDLQSYKNI